MATDLLVGVDVGTTAVKAVAVDADGGVVANFDRAYPTARPAPGVVEQDPDAWMDGVSAALDAFAPHAGRVAAIGLTSQVNTHVFVDAEGRPVRPAIVWQDVRCADDAAALDARVTGDQKEAWFGGPMPIDASHALSRAAFIARTEPDAWAATRHILLPKDYCAMCLTGACATDPVSSVGLVDQGHAYIADLIDLVPGARERLADLHPIHTQIGAIRDGPLAGTPLIVGTMDAWAGMFGVGAVRDGDGFYLSGTSEVGGILSTSVHPTPGIIVFAPYDGLRLHAAPTQAGGASLAWVARLAGCTPAEALTLAADTEASGSTPLFLPHLQGERAPLWDPESRGVFARLSGGTDQGDMVRAVLEGVAFSVAWAFDALDASAGGRPQVLNAGGGGMRSDLWCQMRADVLGTVIRRSAAAESAALGAAILAGVGCGVHAGIAEAADRLVRYDRVFEPDPQRQAYHAERFAMFRRLYEDLRGFNAAFG